MMEAGTEIIGSITEMAVRHGSGLSSCLIGTSGANIKTIQSGGYAAQTSGQEVAGSKRLFASFRFALHCIGCFQQPVTSDLATREVLHSVV